MTRPVIILIMNLVFIFSVNCNAFASISSQEEQQSYRTEFPNPFHKLFQKISHSSFGQKFSQHRLSSIASVKIYFERRRQKRHFRHYAHMTSGRKVNPHQSEKMLKESANKRE